MCHWCEQQPIYRENQANACYFCYFLGTLEIRRRQPKMTEVSHRLHDHHSLGQRIARSKMHKED